MVEEIIVDRNNGKLTLNTVIKCDAIRLNMNKVQENYNTNKIKRIEKRG